MNALKAGDVLLVAGKGGEDYQERMGIKYAYKDEDVIIKITKKE
jgi:UDP-N-acetylmuramyl tripeptide synthase